MERGAPASGYRPVALGEPLGPLFATYWLRVTGVAPPDARDLLLDFGGEATIWHDGAPIEALSSGPRQARPWAPVPSGERRARARAGLQRPVRLRRVRPRAWRSSSRCAAASSRAFDADAWALRHDLEFLLALEAAAEPEWAGELLSGAARVHARRRPRASAAAARAQLGLAARGLGGRPRAPRHGVAVAARGDLPQARAHDDRPAAAARRLPRARLRALAGAALRVAARARAGAVRAGARRPSRAGRWIPVGGTWIEPDCNLPSGESLARQFLYGQRFFERELGRRCTEFWQPDVFGYTAQLPQLMRQAGITRFLTQKLSWNRFTQPEHHTFTWQGLDGSEVLTHFPPADTYNAEATVAELHRESAAYKDHGRSRHSLLVFGYGDGGGGPTAEMLERLRRARDVAGLPRTTVRSPVEFFDELETRRAPTCARSSASCTSSCTAGRTRRRRRSSAATGAARARCTTPSCWPRWRATRIRVSSCDGCGRRCCSTSSTTSCPGPRSPRSTCARGPTWRRSRRAPRRSARRSWARATCRSTRARSRAARSSSTTASSCWSTLPPCGAGAIVAPAARCTSSATADGAVVLVNEHLRAIDRARRHGHEPRVAAAARRCPRPPTGSSSTRTCPSPGTRGTSTRRTSRRARTSPPAGRLLPSPSTRCAPRCVFDRGWIRQTIRLDAGARRLEVHTEVDWQFDHRFLKVAFPLAVHATEATYEVAFGAVRRPTHYSTRADLARYEVPGHRWADLSEHGFGVAVLTDSKYGYSRVRRHAAGLAAARPAAPGPRGRPRPPHVRLRPPPPRRRLAGRGRGGRGGGVQLAACAGEPRRPGSLASVERRLVLDTRQARRGLRRARSLRLYEPHGARGVARVGPAGRARRWRANLLEEPGEPLAIDDGAILVPFRPWEIVTVYSSSSSE